MRTVFIILFLLIVSCVCVIAFSVKDYKTDLIINASKFDRLPDNLAPYCCGEVVGSKCLGKVDLVTASDLVKRGLNPSVDYFPDKSSLRCG